MKIFISSSNADESKLVVSKYGVCNAVLIEKKIETRKGIDMEKKKDEKLSFV